MKCDFVAFASISVWTLSLFRIVFFENASTLNITSVRLHQRSGVTRLVCLVRTWSESKTWVLIFEDLDFDILSPTLCNYSNARQVRLLSTILTSMRCILCHKVQKWALITTIIRRSNWVGVIDITKGVNRIGLRGLELPETTKWGPATYGSLLMAARGTLIWATFLVLQRTLKWPILS